MFFSDDKTKKETVLRPAEHPSVDVTSENMLIIDLKKAENDEADQVPSEFRCKAELTYQAAVIKTIQKNVTLKIEGKPGEEMFTFVCGKIISVLKHFVCKTSHD